MGGSRWAWSLGICGDWNMPCFPFVPPKNAYLDSSCQLKNARAADEYIKLFLPYRLELRPRDKLLEWLQTVSKDDPTK